MAALGQQQQQPPLPSPPGRIPAELRAVFLASQQGLHELCPVPPNLLAASTWHRPVPRCGSSSGSGAAATKSEPQRRYIPRKHPVGGARLNERRAPGLPASVAPNRSTATTAQVPLCPQLHLDALVRSRGYCARRFQSLKTAYFCDPTPLQVASYQAGFVDLVRRGDLAAFRRSLAGGLVSPNPCNRFGESLVHTVCRLGEAPFLRALLDCGATLDVCDDRGRTPLHDACWVPAPHFDVVDLILERDPRLLFVADCRGATPLQYVPRKDWGGWVRFLEGRKDVYWPPRDARRDGPQPPPPLALLKPNARPVPDPPRSLGPERARLAASGEDGGCGSSGGRGSAIAAAAAPPLSLSLVTLRHAGSLGQLMPPPPSESRGGAGASTPAGAAAAAAGGDAEEAAAMVSDEPEEGAEPGSGGGGGGGDDDDDSSLSSSASSCPPSPSSDCDDDDADSSGSDDSSDSDDSAMDESDERLLREMAGRIGAGAGGFPAPR
jgi:hypothetical protein